jgi:hypothetical protein
VWIKFLCAEFFEYLEDSDMSYREAISLSNMEKIATCFTNIGTPGLDGFVPAASFDYANSCLSLLKTQEGLRKKVLLPL